MFAIVVAGVALFVHKRLTPAQKQRLKTPCKIMFVFLQILSTMPANFGSVFPQPFRGLLALLAVPALNIPLESMFGCALPQTDFYTNLLFITLAPIGALMLVVAFYVLYWFLVLSMLSQLLLRLRQN